jgi:predicted acetyltransferase
MSAGLVEVIPAAPDQQPILRNLLELYAHDFSEFRHLELGPDGRFGYQPLPLYWSDPNRHPFLIKVDGQLAGFVLVKRGSEISGGEAVWDIVEFFVVHAYRRRGIGTDIARDVWKRFPGSWEVRVMQRNHPAVDFWQRAIQIFTGEKAQSIEIEKGGDRWLVFSFESR